MASRRQFTFVAALESFHQAARQTVGCNDFGDPVYRNGLRVLADAYDREAHFSQAGQEAVRGLLVHLLANREQHPDALAREP